MDLRFRPLRADEIEVRIARVINGKGVQLLFYKDARVDQNMLDETVGPMNWQRSHSRDNANCTVSIWDAEKKMWVSKEDTGTESNTEAKKGLASDSFKRACFNWGIGRELYTAPDTYVWGDGVKLKDNKCYDRFKTTELTVENGTITHVVVVNSSIGGKEVFRWDKTNVAGADLRSRILAHFNKMSEGNRTKTLEHYGIADIVNITTEQAAQYAKDFKL